MIRSSSQRRHAAALAALAITLAAAACHDDEAAQTGPQPAPAAPKDAIAKTTELGPVKATIKVWPAKPTLGDPIYAQLEIDAPAGITIDAPFQEAGDQRLGRFAVVNFARDTKRKPDGGQVHEQTYTLEAPASGRQRIPPLRFEMTDQRAGAPAAGAIPPLARVRPSRADRPAPVPPRPPPPGSRKRSSPRRSRSRSRRSPSRPPPRPSSPRLGDLDPDVGGLGVLAIVAIVAGVAVLGSGSVLAYRTLRARRRIELQRSAYDVAVGQLQSLEDKGPPEAEAADAWFVALSAIVRRYLEQRYEIRAPELTTEEFLQVAIARPELSTEHRALLTSFLERCDRVKFAGYRPDAEESIATLKAARGFVEDTRVREPIAVAVVMQPGTPGKAA